jgi:hypothetical protein
VDLSKLQCQGEDFEFERDLVIAVSTLYFTSLPVTVAMWGFGYDLKVIIGNDISYSLYKKLYRDKVITGRTELKKRMLKKLAVLSLLCIFCFMCRGILLCLGIYGNTSIVTVKEYNYLVLRHMWVDAFYYFVLELTPSALMVVLFLSPPFQPRSDFASMNIMRLY